MMNLFAARMSSVSLRLWLVGIVSALGLTAVCMRALEPEDSRSKRAEQRKGKELRSLADRIAQYGQSMHQRYPTGDVVVSQGDLATRLRKRPDDVATALSLLFDEQKVQRAPLNGYWKLNV